MLKLAFEVPIPHLPDFEDLQDFHVAHADIAMADPKYREKVKPIGLLIAPPTPLNELRRVVTLCTPHHVTVHPPAGPDDAVRVFLDQCNIAFDTELAVVVDDVVTFDIAVSEDAAVIYLTRTARMSLPLCERIAAHKPGSWLHFGELADAEELRSLIELALPAASLHTAKPIKMAFYDCDWHAANDFPAVEPGQHLTEAQVSRARSLMSAMREVCQ